MATATFYEANAGTGKTRTLTDYILKRVKSGGISLEKVCALTFTEPAAAEMLERLRNEISEQVSKGSLDPSYLQMSGKCFIGTIHSFCLQLVKRYAPQVALPPIFEIDPQEDSFMALFENRWDEFLSGLLLSRDPPDQALIRSLGVTTLRQMAEKLVRCRYDFALAGDDLRWLIQDLADAKKWGFTKKKTWGEFASRLVKDYELHRNVLSAMTQMGNPNDSAYRRRLKDLLACKTLEVHNAISVIQERFATRFLQEYHASGYLLFDDLLRFARDLLRDEQIRSEVKDRYDLVLVDEMQDTEAVQYEIILYLCEKKDRHQNYTLRQMFDSDKPFELESGKLFVVGDPKQSIYGWRNADLTAYESVKKVLQDSGAEILPLNDNYRSCGNLVYYSNVLALKLFPAMRPHDSIAAKKKELCPETNDCIHFVNIHSPDYEKLHLRILSEANWIARKIRALVESGKAQFKDFGVLLRKLIHSHLYVDALSAQQIPVIIEGERFFYRSQEVIDFINLLKFIVDEKDDVALAGLLRSPLFGLTDRDSAVFFDAYRKNGKMLLESLVACSQRMETTALPIAKQIFEIRKQIHLLSPAALIDLTLRSLPVLTVAGLAYGSYRSTLAPLNILRVHKYAIELESDPAFNLFHFVSVLTEFSREGKERAQEPLADEGLDAVRMMSIHNSKGLDFPIVFVPLTDYGIRSSEYTPTEIVHDWKSGIAGIKVNNVTEANYLKLKYGNSIVDESEPDIEDEEKRVLYVAATRAKKEIYFCCLQNGARREIMQVVKDALPLTPYSDEASDAMLQQTAGAPSEYASLDPVIESWTKVKETAAMRGGIVVDSVTNEAEKLEPGEEEQALIAERAKRSGGTLVGLLCHGALEKWDFRSSAQLESLLQNEKGKYFRNFSRKQIDSAADAANEILQHFAASEAARWLTAVQIIGREVPIVYLDREAQKILSGKIDLLIKDGEELCIIDYKTDTSLPDDMRRRYSQQMKLYARALSGSMPAAAQAEELRPSAILTKLLMIRTGELIEL